MQGNAGMCDHEYKIDLLGSGYLTLTVWVKFCSVRSFVIGADSHSVATEASWYEFVIGLGRFRIWKELGRKCEFHNYPTSRKTV